MKIASISLALLGVCLGCQSQSGETASGSSTPSQAPAQPPVAAAGGQYAKVAAIFAESCAGCHGAKRAPGDIHLTSYDALMKGGEHGPIVKAGDPKGSVLVQALHGRNGMRQMPPRGPLPADKIKLIEDWIQAGAKQG